MFQSTENIVVKKHVDKKKRIERQRVKLGVKVKRTRINCLVVVKRIGYKAKCSASTFAFLLPAITPFSPIFFFYPSGVASIVV